MAKSMNARLQGVMKGAQNTCAYIGRVSITHQQVGYPTYTKKMQRTYDAKSHPVNYNILQSGPLQL